MNQNKSPLKAKIKNLPQASGVYLFVNKGGSVVYIGKARSLKDRVKSYFMPNPDPKIQNIVAETADIDFFLTDSEREAAFLENNLVQQYKPKFNLRLKDDKSFPYLMLTVQEPFPGIYLTRRVEADGARYFGPFSPAHQARKTIHLLNKYFGIRGCKESLPNKRKRPCLEYDLKLCAAPCTGQIIPSDYKERVESALMFLEGKTENLLQLLKAKMKYAAGQEKFELAAHWRDLIFSIEQIKEKPFLISIKAENKDFFGLAKGLKETAVCIFHMRRGKVIESKSLLIRHNSLQTDEENLFSFVLEYYRHAQDFPDLILLPYYPKHKDELMDHLRKWKQGRILISSPKQGKNKRLIELANKNAQFLLEKKSMETTPLEALKKALQLETLPCIIEGYDISNTSGKESVGSLVVFKNGFPLKEAYRKYKIKTVRGPNDVASLQEVLYRRFSRSKKNIKPTPDLIMVDGGKGQFSAAKETLRAQRVKTSALIALAKKEELIFSEKHKKGLKLKKSSPALQLLQRVRDEAHRFAISYHRQRRKKESLSPYYKPQGKAKEDSD